MKFIKIFMMLLCIMVSASILAQDAAKPKAMHMKQRPVNQIYCCPMHPGMKSTKPGKCAQCGMDLVKKSRTVLVKYVCPMHPEIVSDKPGKCSKCGMDLVKSPKTAVNYVCPMHPGQTSVKPGKCSQCGMNLEKEKSNKGS